MANKTQITFNRNGKPMTHSFGSPVTKQSAMECFRRNILSSCGSAIITDVTVVHPATADEVAAWDKKHYRPPVRPY